MCSGVHSKVRKAARVLQHLQKAAWAFNVLHLRLESNYASLLLEHGPQGFTKRLPTTSEV